MPATATERRMAGGSSTSERTRRNEVVPACGRGRLFFSYSLNTLSHHPLVLAATHSPRADRFTADAIRWIRHKHGIQARQPRRQGEISVSEAVEQFGVSRHVIYYWMERGYIASRQDQGTKFYFLTIGPEKERELCERIESSPKLQA